MLKIRKDFSPLFFSQIISFRKCVLSPVFKMYINPFEDLVGLLSESLECLFIGNGMSLWEVGTMFSKF